jgi:hypothetical protein
MGTDISIATAGTYAEQAAVANSQRALIIGPNQVKVYLPTGTNNADVLTTLDTGFASAIYCAMWARKELRISDSMCRKRSNTIVDVLPVRTDIALDQDAAYGITFFTKLGSVIGVRDDITTSPSLILQAEPNITMISDDVAKAAIASLDGNVIGALLDETTLTLVTSILDTMLKQKQADRIIRKYKIPTVKQSLLDPRVIEVIVAIQPTFATKYIDITFSYQLSV